MARTNLSLGNLYRAVSGSNRVAQAVSIGGLNGGGTNISMSGFATNAINISMPTYTYIVEGTLETARFDFSLTGSQFFNKVQNKTFNYTASLSNANFSIGTPSIQPAGHSTVPLTAAAIGTTTYAEASSSLTLGYADGYNINATNHGISGKQVKTIYAVDVYNTINQPDFCLLFGTKIQLSDGTELNVEDLMVGDEIKAWVPDGLPDESLDGIDTEQTEWRFFLKDQLSGTTKNVTIADITFNFASTYYSINNGIIQATGQHPLYIWDNEIQKYKFKNLENILIGDKLVMENQTEVEVYSIDKINSDVEIVTINVEDSDVYLANGFISHNKGTTTQQYIPASNLRMYLEPAKSGSWSANAFPAAGAITVDILDQAGYSTSMRGGAFGPDVSPTYVSGSLRKQRCLQFNGTTTSLFKGVATGASGGLANFNTNTGSIHVWIKPTATIGSTSPRTLFDYQGQIVLSMGSSDNISYNRVQLSGSVLGNSGLVTIPSSILSGSWYMISATYRSAGTCTLYVDGSSVGSFTSNTFANPTSANYLKVGANQRQTQFWSGSIGPVLFYNATQDAASVSQVYNYFSTTYKV